MPSRGHFGISTDWRALCPLFIGSGRAGGSISRPHRQERFLRPEIHPAWAPHRPFRFALVSVVKSRFGVAAAASANRLRAKDGGINQSLGRLAMGSRTAL